MTATLRHWLMLYSCGASPGKSPAHLAAARALAEVFAKHDISLVYGGGTVGLMGEMARTLVSLSGPSSVHGIIPHALVRYEAQYDPSHGSDAAKTIPDSIYGRTTIVEDMHARKAMMAQLVREGGPGSGFVSLPGGYGTLEELAEVTTWNQLGIHENGVVVFNVDGYWDGLLNWVRNAVTAGFIGEGNKDIIVEAKTAEECVKALETYRNAEGRFGLDWTQK